MIHAQDEFEPDVAHDPSELAIGTEKTAAIELPVPDDSADGMDAKDASGSLRSFFRVHWRYSAPLDHLLRLVGFVCATASGVALPLMTLVFGSSVNHFNDFSTGSVSGSELYQSLSHNALWFLYLFIGRFVLVYIFSVCFGISGIRAVRALRQDFIKSLIRQDVTYLDSCSPGTVAATISNNADMVENGSTEKIGALVQAMSMFVAAFAVALSRQWALTLVTATTLPALFVGFYVTFSLDAKIEAKILDLYNTASGLVEEALGTVRTVTAFNASNKLRQKYDVYLESAQRLGFKKGPVLGVQYSVEFFTTFCGYSLAWYYGVKLLNEGKIESGGEVITILLAVLLATQAASDVAPGFGDFTRASVAAKGMFDMIDRQSKIDPLAETGERPTNSDDPIQLFNVTFAYPARPTIDVLQNVSLTFESNKTTALVGASGSGKSTIVGLIERWFDPTSGCVRVGDHPVTDFNLRWLRSQIGLVQQEPVLFSDSIYNNVAHGLYGTPMNALPEDEKRELVRQACIQAYADDFIQQLPDKYDTRVGGRGGFLSGGQRQRVAIARSVISNPRILLLDEATSALDPTAEKRVQAALDNVSKSRTTIMIAHKLSTVQKADKIVVLSRGNVVEQGTHQELLGLKGAYHKLVHAQALDTKPINIENDQNANGPVEDDSPALELTDGPKSSEESISENPEFSNPVLDQAKADESQEDFEDGVVSRKLSLVECLFIIIFKEQTHIWPIFLAGFVASVAGGGLFPAQGVLFGESIPTLQLAPSSELVRRGSFWALMYFILGLGVLFCYLGVGFFWTIAAFHATRFYRREYFDSMLGQDISFFDRRGHGAAEMASKLALHPQRLQNLLSTNLALILVIVVNITSCAILSIAVGWQLGLVVIAGGMPVLFGAGYFRMRVEMTNHDRVSKIYLECARFASEAVGAIRTVSSLTLEDKVLEGYRTRLSESARHEVQTKFVSMVLYALSESVSLAVSGLAFWYGGKLLSEGMYDVTTFFIVFISVTMGSHAAGFLFGFSSDTSKAHSAANHIIHLRSSRPFINTSTGVKELPVREKESAPVIEFRDVCFAYPTRPNQPVLQNLTLKVNRSESVGIVGASGCGKSTMIALLERFYDIDSGTLLIEGRSVKELDVHTHRSRVGLVSQETTLYQGTIRENVLLGLPDDKIYTDLTDAAKVKELDDMVTRACQSANIHEFIMSLPDGYSTQIGNRGIALSGGQRQRLVIARALIREPDILLFDEATSALDTASEVQVQAAIDNVARESGRTTVMIAHRLSTIRRCDRIFVLNHGVVVEEGAHEDLVQNHGRYYEMVLAQELDKEIE